MVAPAYARALSPRPQRYISLPQPRAQRLAKLTVWFVKNNSQMKKYNQMKKCSQVKKYSIPQMRKGLDENASFYRPSSPPQMKV